MLLHNSDFGWWFNYVNPNLKLTNDMQKTTQSNIGENDHFSMQKIKLRDAGHFSYSYHPERHFESAGN